MTRLLQRLQRSEAGYSLIELITVMTILTVILGGITSMFVAGSNSEADLNQRFQSQQQARLALDALRRDIHRSCSVLSSSATAVSLSYWDATAAPPACPSAATATTITWCTRASGTKWALYRVAGSACGASGGTKTADFITSASGNVFTYTAGVSSGANAHDLAVIQVAIPVNTSSKAVDAYSLTDDIVLRNSTRS